MARHSYDAERRLFPHWINVDGPLACVSWSIVSFQEARDEAMRRELILEGVSVFCGSGFYSGLRPWFLACGTDLPDYVALAARMTGDAELPGRAEEFAATIREEAGKLTGEFNIGGQRSFPANPSYVKTLLLVFESTGRRRYLDWARELADLEPELLSRPLSNGTHKW